MANYELFKQRLEQQRLDFERQQRLVEKQQEELGENAPSELHEEADRLCTIIGVCESRLREMDEIGEERWNSPVGEALEGAWESILNALGVDSDDKDEDDEAE